jgi:hypothetical protein
MSGNSYASKQLRKAKQNVERRSVVSVVQLASANPSDGQGGKKSSALLCVSLMIISRQKVARKGTRCSPKINGIFKSEVLLISGELVAFDRNALRDANSVKIFIFLNHAGTSVSVAVTSHSVWI